MGNQPGITLPDISTPNSTAVQGEETDGWVLQVDPDTARVMAANETGALVWRLIGRRRTAEETAAAVRNRFPDAPDTAAKDVLELLTELAEEGFIGQEVPLKEAH